jgi:hypothetical protein
MLNFAHGLPQRAAKASLSRAEDGAVGFESKQCVGPVHGRLTRLIETTSANRRFPVRMLQSSKLSPSQFEPELIWTMRSVLDAAVDQIDAANRTPATKAKMAQRILRAAAEGITDSMTLTAIAIEDGMQPAD